MFAYNTGKVDQDTYGEGARMSIRLVKDYAYSNYREIENILGFPYPTEMVYGPHEDNPYVKIWTKINLYSDADTLDGIRSEEWDVVTDSDRGVKVVYFINEWDGTEWHKKPLEDGDSVIIINYEDKPYHEWRIIDGELIDTAEALVEEFKKDFERVEKHISELSATTKELVDFSGWTVNTINEFSASTKENIERIDNTLNTEINNREAGDKKLLEALQQEVEIRDSVDKQLKESIVAEGEQRKKSDDEILSALQKEVELRKSVDDQLNTAITNEIEQRKKSDDEILSALQKEVEIRASVDSQLSDAIKNEGVIRKSVDDQLLAAIKNEGVVRKNNDIVPGTYEINGDNSIETVVPTYSEEVSDVKIKVSEDFFNFGEF
jgi:hypothetical protein